jgi:hypothetical protein
MVHGEDWSDLGPLYTISEERFGELIEGWRAQSWCDARTGLIFGEVMREADGGTAHRANREWARLVASGCYDNLRLVSAAGLELQGDGIHATGLGIDEYGRRFADVALDHDPGIRSDALHYAGLGQAATIIDGELYHLAAEMPFDPTTGDADTVTIGSVVGGAPVVFDLDGVQTKTATGEITKAVSLVVEQPAARLKVWLPAFAGEDQPYTLAVNNADPTGQIRGLTLGPKAPLSQIYIAGHTEFSGLVEPRLWPRTLTTFRLQKAPKADFSKFVAEDMPAGLTLLNFDDCFLPEHVRADITAVNAARGGAIDVQSLGRTAGSTQQHAFASVTDLTDAIGDGFDVAECSIIHLRKDDWVYQVQRDATAPVIPGIAPAGYRLITRDFPSRELASAALQADWRLPDGEIIAAGGLNYAFNSAAGDPVHAMPGVEPSGEAECPHFGLSGDGETDDTMRLAEAFAWSKASGKTVHGRLGDTYNITSKITHTGTVKFDGRGAAVRKSTNGGTFVFTPEIESYDLAEDYVAGSTNLPVVDTGTALRPGQVIMVVSDANEPGQRDKGSATTQYRKARYAFVGRGSTTTNVVLSRPLDKIRGVHPAVSAGDEALVEAFTTAFNARIIVPDMSAEFAFKNVHAWYDDGHAAGQGGALWTGTFLKIGPYSHGLVENLRQTRGYDAMISNVGTYNLTLRECHAEHLANDPENDQHGYGVSDTGLATHIYGLTGIDDRHVYTTNSVRIAVGETDLLKVAGAANTRGARVYGFYGEGGENAPLDTHQGCEDIIFFSPYVAGASGKAAAFRGDVTVHKLQVRNCKYGVMCFTEYQSGDADEDFFTNSKRREDMTKVELTDPDIECEGPPFDFSNATLEVNGTARIKAATHRLFGDVVEGAAGRSKGKLIWGASGTFEASDFDGALPLEAFDDTGVFDLDEPNALVKNAAGFPKTEVTILDGVDFTIDVAAATATAVRGFNCGDTATDTAVENRGTLRIKLPSDGVLFGPEGEFSGSGLYRFELDGAADNAVNPNLVGRRVNVEAVDGSVRWFAPLPSGEMQTLYVDAVETNLDPGDTGAEVDDAYVPKVVQVANHLGTIGSGRIHLRQVFKKTGSNASANLKWDTFGSYQDQFDMPAGDAVCRFDAEIIIQSNTSYTTIVDWKSSDGTGTAADMNRQKVLSDTHAGLDAATGAIMNLDPTIHAADTVASVLFELKVSEGGFF